MTRRRRPSVERTAYRVARAAGDARALRRSPEVYARRVARRSIVRALFRLLRG